ncbi:MAG: DNA polymerase III subunit epsilon [Waddliaceae bacterium]|jgi:DNA polymerase III subunit epsilon|nr:DNA polymerase III subunit epsilon [Waddliaceae bacterium]MBT3578877.1 DNA polymerase III subunit epsilon [Waddliaceae bacterium]MBT4445047.1 DNA polymerase III subunit epsilon [Waddliaceae bacterium]MBT6929055.1 DNA polymerase III subunit epsilon [Waddliaceae bacterium]MBT7264054.1 DNA polymerase III subunit epsilon [Waddliaceae bacterium]
MGLLQEDTFVCFDCESTGLDTENDHIVEFAAIRFTFEGIIDSVEYLIDPRVPIPEEVIAIHNITDAMVAGKPTIDKVLTEMLSFIGDSIVVGHGIEYDIAMVSNAAKRHGISCSLKKNKSLDTLRLARLYGKSPVNSLEFLRKHFSIEERGAHRAMNDVVVNIEVFKKLVESYNTTEDILDALSRPIAMKTMPLGKYKGREFRDIPEKYLLWAKHQNFDEDLLYSIRRELKKRKNVNSFEKSSNPFSSL